MNCRTRIIEFIKTFHQHFINNCEEKSVRSKLIHYYSYQISVVIVTQNHLCVSGCKFCTYTHYSNDNEVYQR